MSRNGAWNNFYKEKISSIVQDILKEMGSEGVSTDLAIQLMFVKVIGEAIVDSELEDVPDIIDRISSEYDESELFEYEYIDNAVVRICRKFSFFFKKDSNGMIPQNGISYYNSRIGEE